MNIDFTQMYVEPGSYYNIPGKALERLSDELNQLSLKIPALQTQFKTDDYTLMLVISAKKNQDKAEVKGPKIRHSSKEAEFALYLPWVNCADFSQEITHVFRWISESIKTLLSRYEIQTSGVSAAAERAIEDILREPEKYQRKSG